MADFSLFVCLFVFKLKLCCLRWMNRGRREGGGKRRDLLL